MKVLDRTRTTAVLQRALQLPRKRDEGATPSVMLAVSDEAQAELLQALFQEAGCVVVEARDRAEALALPGRRYQLVVVSRDIFLELPPRWVRARHVAMLDDHGLTDDVRRGVVDYLTPQPSFDEVSELLDRLCETSASGRGAGGSTTVAFAGPARAGSTFGAMLSLRWMKGSRVGLDCARDPRLATRLGCPPGRSFLDLVHVADELTTTQIKQVITEARVPGLDVVAAPRAWPPPQVPDASARSIVRALQKSYPAVIADVGSHPTDLGRAALEGADRVALFVTSDGESLRDANDFLDATEQAGILDRSKVVGVINRASSKAEMGIRFARRVLRVDVSPAVLPSAWWAIEEAFNHSDPELIRSRRLRRPVERLLVELGLV